MIWNLLFVGLIVMAFWTGAFLNAYYMDESSEDYWQNIGLELVYSLHPIFLGGLSLLGIALAVRNFVQIKSGISRIINALYVVLLLPNFLAWIIAALVLYIFGIEPYTYY